jgi:hypothetical protein
MKNKTILLLIILCSQMACTQYIDISDESFEPILVLNSIITPDSTIKVELYRNTSIYEVKKMNVPNAEVILYENGKELDKLKLQYSVTENPYFEEVVGSAQFDTTFYYTSEKAIARHGSTYKITASASGFETVSAETTIPDPIRIAGIDTSSHYLFVDGFENLSCNFKVNIDDPANTDNYYRVVMCLTKGRLETDSIDGEPIEYISILDLGSTDFKTKSAALTTESETANSELYGMPDNEYKVFNDKLFNGKMYKLELSKEFKVMSIDTTTQPRYHLKKGEFYHFTIYLQSITAATYYYLKSLDVQIFYNDLPFIEPVIVYSNVENGAGVFGSYSVSKYEVTFGEYPVEGMEYW